VVTFKVFTAYILTTDE